MTAAEVLKYEADLHAYADRLRRNDDERHVAAQHQADGFSRQVLRWQSEARMLEVEAKAAHSIKITLAKMAEQVAVVQKSVEENYERLGSYAEQAFIDQASEITKTRNRVEKAERTEIAKKATVETKHVISDKLGRPIRIETRHDGVLVYEKVITYGTTGVLTGRIVNTIERPVSEKQHPENPFLKGQK